MTNTDIFILTDSLFFLRKAICKIKTVDLYDSSFLEQEEKKMANIIKNYNLKNRSIINTSTANDRHVDTFYRMVEKEFFSLLDQYLFEYENIDCYDNDLNYILNKKKKCKIHVDSGFYQGFSFEVSLRCIDTKEDYDDFMEKTNNCEICKQKAMLSLEINSQKYSIYDSDRFSHLGSSYPIYSDSIKIFFDEQLKEYLLVRQEAPLTKDYNAIHRVAIEVIKTNIASVIQDVYGDYIKTYNELSNEVRKLINKYK